MVVELCVGGLLGGKFGVSVFYMGSSKKGLQLLYDILENSDVLIGKLLFIYVNCSEFFFEQVLVFVFKGGVIDIIISILDFVVLVEGIVRVVKVGVLFFWVMFSLDGNGSQLLFDVVGNLMGIGVVGFESLLEMLQMLVNYYGFSLIDVLCLLIISVVVFFSLDGKGEICFGNDVDLFVFSVDLCIEQVYVCGKCMVNEGKVCVKGIFELV